MFYKPEIRRKIIEKRSHLTDDAIAQAAKQVASQLVMLPSFMNANHLGYYMAHAGECDPSVAVASAHGKSLYLPVAEKGDEPVLAYYEAPFDSPLDTNQYGIKEPETEGKSPVALSQMDCLLIPLVAFDESCQRIGRGAGYYDRYLADIKNLPEKQKPVLIGLAYEFQKIDKITPDEWDIPMDFIVTEKTVYSR